MAKACVLEDDKICNDCGNCDICDLDPAKTCDNCMKCLEADTDYNAIEIEDILVEIDGE